MQGFEGTFFYLIIFFGILYFLMIRPQQKQQKKRKDMLASVKVGDKIVTIGGMHGRVTRLDDEKVTVRAADKVEIEFDRGAIGRVMGQEE